MKVAVLTTSYPRWDGDVAGLFVADAVERVRARGVEVEVVSPRQFDRNGIAYGSGIVGNLRRDPWRAAFLPAFLAGFTRTARAAAAGASVVHAHWLPTGLVGLRTGKPLVLQLWGTDVALARDAKKLARAVVSRARVVIAPSRALASAAWALGAQDVRVVSSGVDIPARVGEPADPPEVLYAGRLSEEKGVLDLAEAAAGLPLIVAGDGPLRDKLPGALGFVPHDELAGLYERASVVVCPSHREGFGVVCAEAMAYGRPVVATAVGGFLDLVVDGETGLLVPPHDPRALREAIERLLGDDALRRRLGAAARERAREHFSWDAATEGTLAAYRTAAA